MEPVTTDLGPILEPDKGEPLVTNKKRGWLLDALYKVGQLEAAMSHNDEQISFLKEQLEGVQDAEEANKIVDEIALNEEIIRIDYQNRVDVMNDIFDSFGGNRHYYCQVKHRAADWVAACEVFHTRGMKPEDEESMHRATQTLALTCSVAFGFKPFSCLRCFDEAAKQKELGNSVVE